MNLIYEFSIDFTCLRVDVIRISITIMVFIIQHKLFKAKHTVIMEDNIIDTKTISL